MSSQNDEFLKKVNWQLGLVVRGKPKKLYDAAQHLIQSGGKRIRPVLCLLACQSVKGKIDSALSSAAALELVHTFTLIHDDIMDEDDLRRGSPSVHKIYGNSTAILAGDLLFSKAFEICDPKVKTIIANASVEICEGQEMDVSFEKREDVMVEEYLEMIRKKTAVLFEASTKAGAVLASADKKTAENLASYGRNLGMAFQVCDDILGIVGEEKKLGKPIGSDIAKGKKSLVIITALRNLSTEDSKKLMRILMKSGNSEREIKEAIKMVEKSGAIEYCKKEAKGYIDEAKKSLSDVPGSDAKKSLIEIADFVIEREM